MTVATSPLDAALAAIHHAIDDGRDVGSAPSDEATLVGVKCAALMKGYNTRWNDAGWETISVEEQFHLPINNPDTGRVSRTYTQAGKYDGIASREGKLYLVEHKTTGEDISDPNANYWRRLTIDSQVSSYMLANWQNGRKLAGTLYDVVRKPTIRPKELLKSAIQGIVANGVYCGKRVSREIQNAVAKGQSRECPALYGVRLEADVLEKPNHYFGRRIVPRLDNELLEWASELWNVGQELHAARRENRHYRNSDACMSYGRPCEYLGICSGHNTPDSDSWWQLPFVHEELQWSDQEDDGKNVLTHSRLKCFQTCRRKHYYRYELGLRKVDEEDKDARYFGTVWHAALAAWWSCFKVEKSNDNGNTLSRTERDRWPVAQA